MEGRVQNQTVSLSGIGLEEQSAACVEKTETLLKHFPLRKKRERGKSPQEKRTFPNAAEESGAAPPPPPPPQKEG